MKEEWNQYDIANELLKNLSFETKTTCLDGDSYNFYSFLESGLDFRKHQEFRSLKGFLWDKCREKYLERIPECHKKFLLKRNFESLYRYKTDIMFERNNIRYVIEYKGYAHYLGEMSKEAETVSDFALFYKKSLCESDLFPNVRFFLIDYRHERDGINKIKSQMKKDGFIFEK